MAIASDQVRQRNPPQHTAGDDRSDHQQHIDCRMNFDKRTDAAENGDQSAANTAPADSDYLTVQVGVFLDDKEAGRLLQQMESKGYRPTFFSGRDAESRQWYAVRIGVYSDKQQAANAAANFTKQEKLKAVVRPVESL